MKKLIALILAAVLVLAAGCAKKDAGLKVDAAAAADKLASSVQFTDQMSAVADKTVLKLYGLEQSTVEKLKAYESTGATAEEVAVFEAKDEDAAAKVKEAAQKRIEDQKAAFQDYQPKEMAKLKNPLLVTAGKYVVLCVSNDNAAAQKAVDGLTK